VLTPSFLASRYSEGEVVLQSVEKPCKTRQGRTELPGTKQHSKSRLMLMPDANKQPTRFLGRLNFSTLQPHSASVCGSDGLAEAPSRENRRGEARRSSLAYYFKPLSRVSFRRFLRGLTAWYLSDLSRLMDFLWTFF
jgi:hypothetical protein